MGIVLVAFLAARIGMSPPATTMISTLRRTSSAASSGYRSGFPSAYRYSMATFCPAMYPSSRRASRIASERAESVVESVPARYPYPGDFRRLLGLSHSPTHRECDNESNNPRQFSIFDFGFPIIGNRDPKPNSKCVVHQIFP
jgi:hypothetical protein